MDLVVLIGIAAHVFPGQSSELTYVIGGGGGRNVMGFTGIICTG